MNYVIRANRAIQVFRLLAYKGGAEPITVDFSPWADDGGTVTAVTAEVKSGDASISNESISSNVKSFLLTTAQAGSSMVKLTGTAGNNKPIVHIYVVSKDPNNQVYDYGITQG